MEQRTLGGAAESVGRKADTLEKDLQNKNKTAFLSQTHLRKKTFKIKLGLERLSWLRSRFLCSQQRGPGHLGSMPQENMQCTTNLFFL